MARGPSPGIERRTIPHDCRAGDEQENKSGFCGLLAEAQGGLTPIAINFSDGSAAFACGDLANLDAPLDWYISDIPEEIELSETEAFNFLSTKHSVSEIVFQLNYNTYCHVCNNQISLGITL